MKRYSAILFLAACLYIPAALQAQGISSVVVTAPEAIVVAGSQMQLQALARDNQGNPRNNDRFNFNSSNPAVISVNSSGVATAIRPGIANVTASVQGANFTSPAVSLQVVPLRIDVTAESSEVTVGDALQFNATVVDVNEQPITGVAVRWQITGANGFNTRAAAIDNAGLLTTSGIGLMTIHAQLVYATQSSAQVPTFEGLTQILIKARKEFKLTRLLASAPMNRSFTLRPAYNSEPAVNDSGQVAFTGNLDGVGSALLLYDNGQWDMLASAGTPGPLGGYIWHFEGPPAINSRGDVLVRVGTSFSWGLMRVSKSSGSSFLLETGTSEGFARMNFFRAGRYSINDQGDIAFIADYQLIGSTAWNTGLFVLNDQGFRYVWATLDPLTSFPFDYTFDNSMFGIDNQGVVYFRVISGRNSAIYRADGSDAPKKIIGTGNRIGGFEVQDALNLAMSPNGSIAFNVTGTSGENAVVRLRRTASNLESLSQRSVGLVMSVNDAGDTLYSGDPGIEPFWGIYKWRDSATQLFRLFNDSALEGGEKPNWAKTGRITSRGESYVSLDAPENHLLIARVDSSSPRTLFKAGTVLSAAPYLNFQGIVPGALAGPLHIFGGGGNASILEVGSSLRTIWVPGDRPVQGITGWTITHAAKNPIGDLYLTLSDGIMRIRNGTTEAIARFPVTDRDRGTLRGPAGWWDYNNSFSANSSGAFVFNARTDSENRLELYDRGVFIPIMVQGGSSQTASPAGGRFFNILGTTYRQNAVLIDERARVLANAQVINGPSGLFLYENGQWKTAAAFLRTNIAGSLVSGCRAIHVAGNNFYALLDFTNGDSMIAQYDGETWTPLVRRFDVMPDGTSLTSLYAAFAVNRSGDLVYAGNANGEKVILRTADAVSHLVYTEMAPTETGDFFPNQTFEFDIRDDGQIYFVGFDILGRNTVYKADRIQ